MPAYRPLEERFWEKVVIKSDAECWLWTGASNAGCYGRVRLPRQKRSDFAHRVAYQLKNGPIPEDRIICHRCGNSLCVNPAHLYAGTASENNMDRIRHGRQSGGARKGEKHHMAKISDEQRIEIMRRLHAGEVGKKLASEYSISPTHISRLKKAAVALYGSERDLLAIVDKRLSERNAA